MTSLRSERLNTSFKGDVVRLASGTGAAQLITLLAAPVLTRLYAPEAFGVAALFASITGILGVLACMRYELSIVLPDNNREAANLLAVSLGFSVLIALLAVVLVWFGGPYVLSWVGMPELAPYLWLVPLMVLIHGLFTALNYWNTRTRHFTRLSIARVISSLTNTSASLSAGFAGHATGGALIAASVGGQAVGTTVLGSQIWRDDGRFILGSLTWRAMWAGLKRHRKFPTYSSWSGIFNTASWQLPVLMLGTFFSPAIAGFYALGFRILQIPMSLIGNAIAQVFHQRAAEAHNQGTLAPLVETLLQRLLIVGLLPTLVLMIVGRDLYAALFGAQWAEAGIYTQILSGWALVWFISSPLSTVFGVTGHQAQGLLFQSTLFFSRLLSLLIGGFFENVILAITLFSLTGFLVYLWLVTKVLDLAGSCVLNVISAELQKSMFIAIPFALAVLIVKIIASNDTIILGAGMLSVAAYFFFLRKEILLSKRFLPGKVLL